MRHISSAPGCLGHRRADSRIAGTCIPPATGIVTNTHDMRRQSRTEVETGAKSGGRARRSYLPNTTYSGLVKQPDKHELASYIDHVIYIDYIDMTFFENSRSVGPPGRMKSAFR